MTQYIAIAKNAKNLTGQRFGRLIALGPIDHYGKHIEWLCQCDCGNRTRVSSSRLRCRTTQSCGCWQKELAAQQTRTHGMTKHPLFNAWQHMNQRCSNPNASGYANYGGRGITVCDEWRHDFKAFYNHVSQLPHFGEKGRNLDRVDNSLGYQPGNVRWATPTQQNRNSRNNHKVTYQGKTLSVAEWTEATGLPYHVLTHRLRRGWTAERALTTPVRFYPSTRKTP